MSADNFYLIRKHPLGGFAAVMGFDSDESVPAASAEHRVFESVSDAVRFANGSYSEYGTSIHPECRAAS